MRVHVGPGFKRFSGCAQLHMDGLDFKLFSLNHTARDLQAKLSASLLELLAFSTGYFPLDVSILGGLSVPRTFIQS
jgi:hypothetical protein